jgi:3-phenylpropionate/trans-cinnamate dioxygenase ferredoxin reductase subunit
MTLRTIADVERIRGRLNGAQRIVIVGGGYIGLEVAAVLAALGRHVTLVEAQHRLLARVSSEPVSAYFQTLHRAHGVDVRLATSVKAIEPAAHDCTVCLADGTSLPADLVLASVGGRANDAVARASGIAVDDGILVDAAGRTSAPDVFAAGDCARAPSKLYGRSRRL